jgi:hypothetical protein
MTVASTESAQRYAAYLQSLLHASPSQLQRAASAVLDTTRHALAQGGQLQVAQVPLTARLIAGLSAPERAALINQANVGFGRENAPVIVMGTEPAYSLDNHQSLATECYGLAPIRLAGGRAEIVSHIADDASWRGQHRAYHLYPDDYLQVHQPTRKQGHTWPVLANIIARALSNSKTARQIESSLGDYCYQVELSVYPAPQAAGGLPPPQERVEFLKWLVATLAGTTAHTRIARDDAKLLIFHGMGGVPAAFRSAKDQICAAFLGVPFSQARGGTVPVLRGHTQPMVRTIEWYEHGSRRAIYMDAPGFRPNNPYKDEVAKLMRESPQ